MPSQLIIAEHGINQLTRIYAEAGGNLSFKKDIKVKIPLPSKKSKIPILGFFINFYRKIVGYLKAPKIPLEITVDFKPLPEFDFVPGGKADVIAATVWANAKVRINKSRSLNALKLEAQIETRPMVLFQHVTFKWIRLSKVNFKILNHNVPKKYVKAIKKIVNTILKLAEIFLADMLKVPSVQAQKFKINNSEVSISTKVTDIAVFKDDKEDKMAITIDIT